MYNPVSSISKFRIGLSALNIAEQKSIFDCLPATVQAAVWQDRLSEGIAALSDRSQCRLLSELQDLLNPDCYSEDKANHTATSRLEELSPVIEKVFPDHSVFHKYTQQLGDNACESPIIEIAKGAPPTCTCSSSRSCMWWHNDCGAMQECLAGGCKKTNVGCGVLWLQTCDGLCTGNWC
ncbi:bacteriocin fulvocin C-related protein [Ruegeria faecimaris]|uniref:Uncharacterized protein n=2 Tax=Ruegeria faecimaris TaxID=686389 RepID=A0A521CDU9_9RHOB|nr:hypothetical protein SAMN06265380_102356 [Ruegeria faecimaris]